MGEQTGGLNNSIAALDFRGATYLVDAMKLDDNFLKDLVACGRHGCAGGEVDFVMGKYKITGDERECRAYLRSYGAYGESELDDHQENLRRLVWLVGCGLADRDGVSAVYFNYTAETPSRSAEEDAFSRSRIGRPDPAAAQLVSTGERLSKLPTVFSLDMAAAELGVTKEIAQSYIQRWKIYGLIAGAGKTGIYININRSPDIAGCLPEAVAMAVRRPIVEAGEAIAARGGLTHWEGVVVDPGSSQRTFMVCVGPASRSLPHIDGIDLRARPDWWLDAISSSRATVRTASPQMAIADLLLNDHIAAIRSHRRNPDLIARLSLSSSVAAAVEQCLDTILRAAPRRGIWAGMTGRAVLQEYLQKPTIFRCNSEPAPG